VPTAGHIGCRLDEVAGNWQPAAFRTGEQENRMILIVSSPSDTHTTAVLGELSKLGATAQLLDLSEFPQRTKVAIRFECPRAHNFSLHLDGGKVLDLDDFRAIWWRRPQPYRLHAEIMQPEHQAFAYTESHEAFSGLWQALDVFWVNHPTRDEVAARKVFQLRIAQEVGLDIPHTLITNDPEHARAFISSHGSERTIYKAFSATEQHWRETRILKPDEVALIDNVKYAPVIFQEYIPAQYDIRITIVGDEMFPAAIHSQESSYKVDFRMDMMNTRIEAVRLPDEVESGLRALMSRLGLVYGAVDMRLTPDGRYIFLEINPAGQWLFIEDRSRQPITAALANILASHDH
jgi:glutathione synthase/RimK-type ligase-like ATP-grasp enzyme